MLAQAMSEPVRFFGGWGWGVPVIVKPILHQEYWFQDCVDYVWIVRRFDWQLAEWVVDRIEPSHPGPPNRGASA